MYAWLYPVADPPRGHAPKLMAVSKNAVRVADVVTQCFDVFATCEDKCSVPSSAGTPAPLIEPQSAWNVRLDRRSLLEV